MIRLYTEQNIRRVSIGFELAENALLVYLPFLTLIVVDVDKL